MIPGKTNQQCRQRYVSKLRSGVSRHLFSLEEDLAILKMVRSGERRWVRIAGFLSNRTSTQVYNRY